MEVSGYEVKVNELRIGILGVLFVDFVRGGFGHLLIELAPFLLGPSELLDRGREVEEVNRNDRGTGPEVGVSDESVQLTAGLDKAGMDPAQALALLTRVEVLVAAQGRSSSQAAAGCCLWRFLDGLP